jgi:4-diphosphocytidyl-2-C-methyl-D-erythritol kinase
MTRSAAVAAHAKVNLFLRVLGRRRDGYHEIQTLFQAIDLADEIRVELGGREVELHVEGADLGAVEDNLAFRAAAELRDKVGIRDGANVSLVKRTPVGAGLGGGSSDAAAVLRCLGRLWSVDDAVTLEVAAGLGSDVPFFLGPSPLAVGSGRGEVLEPLEALPPADLVLVSPPVHVSTAAAYRALDERRPVDPGDAPAGRSLRPESWHDVAEYAHNDFQDLIALEHPEVQRALGALGAAGALISLMSGSGSSCFGLFPDASSAGSMAAELRTELGWPCLAVRTLESLPEPRTT